MIGTKLAWTRQLPTVGNMVRWRDNPRHRWNYGVYAGQDAISGALMFRRTSDGPVSDWMMVAPRFWEVAYAAPVSVGEGNTP